MEWGVESVIAILAAVGSVLGTIGVGGRWLITRIDEREHTSREQYEKAVGDLKKTLDAQIERLQRQLERAEADLTRIRQEHDAELAIARQERDRWLREYLRLRTILETHDIPLPDLGAING